MATAAARAVNYEYDFQAEFSRYGCPDVEVGGLRLNRGTARPVVDTADEKHASAARSRHREHLLPTTVPDAAPVVELGFPTAGMYMMDSRGVYLDAVLGVAQRLFDENHPRLQATLAALARHGLLLRREINTDDFLAVAAHAEGVHTSQDLAALFNGMAQASFPAGGPFKSFISNSGTEAVEAGIKAATLVKYRRLVEKYGLDTFADLCWQLGIERDRWLSDGQEPVWEDYPFFLFAAERAFHGRTLGSLSLTHSKAVQVRGFPKLRWVRHIPFNRDHHTLDSLIDWRPLPEILRQPGGVAAVVGAGRVPADLAAAVVIEGFQGEGGYRPMRPSFAHALRGTCDRAGMLLVADEVQTFARTGRTFMFEHLGVEPDVVAVAKAAVTGLTAVRAELERYLTLGWHANTWGGGKIFDIALSHATIDTFVNYVDPVFDGLSYAENLEAKGAYLAAKLDTIRKRLPGMLLESEVVGGMAAITVRRREEVIAEAWRRGLKLLGCGDPGPESRIRILLLADVITKEIDDLAEVLEDTLKAVERGPATA